jgi:hypothetical protein
LIHNILQELGAESIEGFFEFADSIYEAFAKLGFEGIFGK